jgi:hypothetical protein
VAALLIAGLLGIRVCHLATNTAARGECAMSTIRLIPTPCEATAVIADEDQPFATVIKRNLMIMTFYANEVSDTVRLFSAIQALPFSRNSQGWAVIPAKQAIVSLYNYRMAMDAVVTNATRASNGLAGVVDTKRMEALKVAFRQQHPNTKELRQSILHQAELMESPERTRATGLRDGHHTYGPIDFGVGGIAQSNLINGVLQMTFQGQIYTLPMTKQMAEDLYENALEFINCVTAIGGGAQLVQLK